MPLAGWTVPLLLDLERISPDSLIMKCHKAQLPAYTRPRQIETDRRYVKVSPLTALCSHIQLKGHNSTLSTFKYEVTEPLIFPTYAGNKAFFKKNKNKIVYHPTSHYFLPFFIWGCDQRIAIWYTKFMYSLHYED